MNKGLPEHLLYKNRLQEYTQRLGLQLPVYETTSEGHPHAPKFRASVRVNQETYTSMLTFPHKKDAEQNVANIALQAIKETKESTKPKSTAFYSIYQNPKRCKSILNEFAFRTNRASPTYKTIQQHRLYPVYVSSLVFNGKTYQGKEAGCMQEAEQLVAQIAIESLLETDSGSLLQLILSKNKTTAAAGVKRAKTRSPQSQRPGPSKQPVNVSSSFPNLNSEGPSTTPNQKKRRTMGDDNSKQKQKQKQIRSRQQ